MLRGETPVRYWVVAVVSEKDKIYVIRCDSSWEHRQMWRDDFQSLLKNAEFRD